MGEDFFNARNERFATLRDVQYSKELEPNLFSTCPASTQTTVLGDAVAGVGLGLELWGKVPPAGPITFYAGDVPAVVVDGCSADHLRSEHGLSAPLVASVVGVNAEHGVVRLELGCPR